MGSGAGRARVAGRLLGYRVREVVMSGLFRLVRLLVVLTALAAIGTALWRRRDQLAQGKGQLEKVWESLGGTEGAVITASKLVESAGPVRDLIGQFANLKK